MSDFAALLPAPCVPASAVALKSDVRLRAEIAADKAGLKEYSEQEHLLIQRRNVFEKRLNANKLWAANFDLNIGGLTKHHSNLVDTTRSVQRFSQPCSRMGADFGPLLFLLKNSGQTTSARRKSTLPASNV